MAKPILVVKYPADDELGVNSVMAQIGKNLADYNVIAIKGTNSFEFEVLNGEHKAVSPTAAINIRWHWLPDDSYMACLGRLELQVGYVPTKTGFNVYIDDGSMEKFTGDEAQVREYLEGIIIKNIYRTAD